jgi:uncharacterized protein (TIGR03382 family)
MHRIAALVAATLLPLSACIEDDLDSTEKPETLDIVGTPAVDGDLPRGLYVVIPPELEALDEEQSLLDNGDTIAFAGDIIYMNRVGGTYTPGNNNSSTNRSSVPNTTSVIPPWNVSEAGWNEVMTCVAAQFAPFDITVTDVDPGDTPHWESVVAGSPGDLGFPNGVGGVSPFTSDCSVIQRSVVYTFAEVFGNNYRVICEVVAQEVAHSFGLDHQFLCEDPMTYLGGCGAKTFQNIDAQCGEDQPRTCACGQATQNSVTMLTQRIGAADEQLLPPTVGISSPNDGQTVAQGFNVVVEATDDRGVSQVELLVDGIVTSTLTSSPYAFNTDPNLDDGTHVVETRATDTDGQVSTASIAVNVDVDMDPNDPVDPNDPQDPNDPDGPRPADLVGGCSTTGTSGGASSLFLIGLGLLLTARRRRA